ncbi:MAG TPA: 8-oxo-dGTP diphosphatase [Bacillota bacterium]|nr:8-oxo-dGTP diphosphatase [Bacillota bacterium]
MLQYTICFIRKDNEILMLNRESAPWMGVWNGVGGKLEKGETPTECVLREISEETGLELSGEDVTYKGMVTWEVDQTRTGGMYAFIANLPNTFELTAPIKTNEGILDWKNIDWLLDPENTGVANVKYFLKKMLEETNICNHQFVYEGRKVVQFNSIPFEK